MVRVQIRLTEEQIRALKRLAHEQQRSVADPIRQSVDLYLAAAGELPLDRRVERATAVVGKYLTGDADLGRDYDRHFSEQGFCCFKV